MGLLDLFLVASMPVLKILLITSLGSFLALDSIDILGETARKNLNTVVFYVFSPAIVCSNLANTVTLESITLLWFMPFNIFITFIIGSALAWILVIITKAPQHLKGLVVGTCSAGNLGMVPLFIMPALCKEKESPFGDPDICNTYAMSYASLSMAPWVLQIPASLFLGIEMGAIFIWSYVYNIVRVLNTKIDVSSSTGSSINVKLKGVRENLLPEKSADRTLPSEDCTWDDESGISLSSTGSMRVPILYKIKQQIGTFSRKIKLKSVLAPSTIAAAAGFLIGLVPQLRKLLIGATAPLHAVYDSAFLLGNAAIPLMTLIGGGNLLIGAKRLGVPVSIIFGIVAIRYILLPLIGIIIVKGVIHIGLVHPDPLYQFMLLLQFALPPAMNMGTITQLFGVGQSECSVILLWTYLAASVSLTIWSTLFMWLVS